MSLRRLSQRRVEIVPMVVVDRDGYGNEVRAPDLVDAQEGVRARREPIAGDEDRRDRTQQIQRFRYFLPPYVVITGRDRIVDDGETFEIDGPPHVAYRRRHRHHIEVTAYRVEG